jgi:hypothetical protein
MGDAGGGRRCGSVAVQGRVLEVGERADMWGRSVSDQKSRCDAPGF